MMKGVTVVTMAALAVIAIWLVWGTSGEDPPGQPAPHSIEQGE